MDLRLPIGGLFGIFGLILTVFGIAGPKAIYTQSLGIDVNLWWGIVMLAFGAVMGGLGWRASKGGPGAKGPILAAQIPRDLKD